MRRSFRVWEEEVLPRTLFEIASRKTWRQDVGEKRELYARIRIKEYILFVPEARYLRPQLQGFRSYRGQPVPLKPLKDGSLKSTELGLLLTPEGRMLRLRDLKTGEMVLTRAEQAERLKQLAKAERDRADELAERLAALQDEVNRLRRGDPEA
jgi:hypothetical protein